MVQPNQYQNNRPAGQKSAPQNQQAPRQHSVYALSTYCSFDLPTDLELDLLRNWKEFSVIAKKASTQTDRVNLLQRAVTSSDDQHNTLISGMIFGILVAPPQNSQIVFQNANILPYEVILQDLKSIVRDNFQFAVYILCRLVRENFDVFQELTLQRIVWMTDHLLSKSSVPNLKDLVLALLHRVSGSRSNVKSFIVNKTLVEILINHVDWVCAQQDRFPSIVFIKFLRQAEEHFGKNEVGNLQERELLLCVAIWQSKQVECIEAGRELVRVFQNISERPEMAMIKEELSKSIRGKPLMKHLLEKRGNKQGEKNIFVSYLLSYEVQRRLDFMLFNLPEENAQWHLKWLLEFAGIEFGKESESILVDIVRYIVVNVTPSNEVIHSNILQRFKLIGMLITQQKHKVHQSWVLQALFIDWLYYDEKATDSIMLVEPGMLLLYRSADKHPRMTDMLVEYLDNYIKTYDPQRIDEAFLSVQRVFVNCESKGVVQSIKSGLINNPKLQQHTQMRLKQMYRASQIQAEKQKGNNYDMHMEPEDTFGGPSLPISHQGAEDMDMMGDDGNISGQFSPPHDREDDMISDTQNTADQDSPYADQIHQIAEGMLLDPIGKDSDIEDYTSYALGDKKQYNIDLFQGDVEEKKVKPHKSGDNVEMKEEKKSSKKSRSPRKRDDDKSGGENSSSSSDSEGSSSDSEQSVDDTPVKNTTIEVPASVIQRFFTKKASLTSYLVTMTEETTYAMLDDLCKTYKFEEGSKEELTELSYILFESLKGSLMCQDMIKLLSKWKQLAYVHIFSYLQKLSETPDKGQQSFVVVANLVKSMTQFDPQFEVKLATHFTIESSKAGKPDQKAKLQQILLNYASLHYPVGQNPLATAQQAGKQTQSSLLPLKRFLNEGVVAYLIQTCQFKFINYFLVAVVNDLSPQYATDNEQFLATFILFCTPQSLMKVASTVRLGQVSLFEFGLKKSLTSLPTSFFSQQALWTLLLASLSQHDSTMLKPVTQHRESPIDSLCQAITDALPSQAGNSSQIAALFLGLQQYTVTYNSIVVTQQDGAQKEDRIERGLHSMLEMYARVEQLQADQKGDAKTQAAMAASLRGILRDTAQTILIGFFTQGTPQQHQHLLQSLIVDQATAAEPETEKSQSARNKTMLRLRVAKDIFRSKLSQKVVLQSELQDQVSAICSYQLTDQAQDI